MSGSTLDPQNFPGQSDEHVPKGHDTKSLGPSDSSDSGSDMAGPGLLDEEELKLDRGTNEDAEAGQQGSADAGPSIGDVNMDDNSDSSGTGEHLTAGKDPRIRVSGDIDTDRIVTSDEAGLGAGLDEAEEAILGMTDEEIEAAARSADEELDDPSRRRAELEHDQDSDPPRTAVPPGESIDRSRGRHEGC